MVGNLLEPANKEQGVRYSVANSSVCSYFNGQVGC